MNVKRPVLPNFHGHSLVFSHLKIALVASHNGMGHTSRLLKLGEVLAELGHENHLIIGPQQASLLKAAAASRKNFLVIETLEPHWVDGPYVRTPRRLGYTRKKTAALGLIRDADLVISDNVSWPIEVNQRTVLYSHFTWADYLISSGRAVPEEERNRLKLIKLMVSPRGFSFPSIFFTSDNREMIPLPLFEDFGDLQNENQLEEIWVTAGVTGSNQLSNKDEEFLLASGLRVVRSETFRMRELSSRPLAFFGRPGMASVTEALSAAVPYFPSFSGTDPELDETRRNLYQLGFNLDLEALAGMSREQIVSDMKICTSTAKKFSQSQMQPAVHWALNLLALAARKLP